MAKRKYSKMAKIQPAVQTIFIPGVTTNVAAGNVENFYLDLSQIASIVNRRFYRQGLNWAVSGIKIQTGIVSGSIEVSKLPNTWVLSNAWEKGFRAWQKMNNKALEENPSIKPRFLDFKVYADATHHSLGVTRNLMPSGSEPSLNSIADAGEWEYSKFSQPASTASTTPVAYDREIIATGANYPGAGASGLNAVSLIEGYAASRGLPNVVDPNVPTDTADTDGAAPENWISAIFNEGIEQSADIIDVMIEENNIAPYPFEGGANQGTNPYRPVPLPDPYADTMYPGGANQMPGLQMHDSVYWTNTAQTILEQHRIKGGNFPCGLIKFAVSNTGDTDAGLNILIDLVPGTHRGYLCEPMTEM